MYNHWKELDKLYMLAALLLVQKKLALISMNLRGRMLANDCNSISNIHVPAIWVGVFSEDLYIAVLCFPSVFHLMN